jgi:predicted Zn-dependent protease
MAFASRWAALDLRSQPWQVLYMAAASAVEHSDWLVAEPLLEQVIEQVPGHAAAHHLLGKVWREQERLEAALEAQQRSCALDPGLGWNWFAAGELLLELERWPEAVQALVSRGRRFALQPGMALTAQIKLQQRTILQLVFSRFNQGLDAVRTLR